MFGLPKSTHAGGVSRYRKGSLLLDSMCAPFPLIYHSGSTGTVWLRQHVHTAHLARFPSCDLCARDLRLDARKSAPHKWPAFQPAHSPKYFSRSILIPYAPTPHKHRGSCSRQTPHLLTKSHTGNPVRWRHVSDARPGRGRGKCLGVCVCVCGFGGGEGSKTDRLAWGLCFVLVRQRWRQRTSSTHFIARLSSGCRVDVGPGYLRHTWAEGRPERGEGTAIDALPRQTDPKNGTSMISPYWGRSEVLVHASSGCHGLRGRGFCALVRFVLFRPPLLHMSHSPSSTTSLPTPPTETRR